MRKLLITFLITLPASGIADTTIKTHTVITDTAPQPGIQNPMEHTEIRYRKGSMRRKDSLGTSNTAKLANIANCDLHTGFIIDTQARQYRSYKVIKFLSMAELEAYQQKHLKNVVQIESNTVDTGERRVFFGHSARHLITTTTLADDQNNTGGKEIIDAWYIDHELPDNNCAPDFVRTEPYYVVGTALAVPPQIPRFHHTGPIPAGLIVKSIVTIVSRKNDHDRTFTIEETVQDLSDAPLDPSLFELPSGMNENPGLLKPR